MSEYYYFRAPNFQISPDSPIAPKLGSIFPTLKRLTSPLNQNDLVPIPPELKNNNEVTNFSDTSERTVKSSMGVNACFPQPLGAGVDLIYGFASDTKRYYHCDHLETLEFQPGKDYVAQCIRTSQHVQEYIQGSLFGHKMVYMITGLKIATGFSMTEAKSSDHGPMLKVGINAKLLGVPFGGGPQVELTSGNSRELSYEGMSKIVFAYRAIKIRPQKDGTVKYRDMSGGVYGLGDDEEDELELEIEAMDEKDRATDFPDSVVIPVVYLNGSS